jgi:hypothetical protein
LRCLGIVLGKGSADPGGDHPALGLAGVRHGIAHEMNAASLPERIKSGTVFSKVSVASGNPTLPTSTAATTAVDK